MRGYPRYNFEAFEAAEMGLIKLGYNVLSPHRMDLDLGFNPEQSLEANNFSVNDAVRRDVEAIIASDCVYMLAGWEHSTGAMAEWAIAKWLGRTIIYQDHPKNYGN